MKHISLNLNFAGAILPIVEHEDGHDRVPFKPLVEAIGLQWETQYRKVQDPYLVSRLGVCVAPVHHADQVREMVCIRFDRVESYLNTVNPRYVRANGNESAADFLVAKHEEWDDVLHAYEQQHGGLFNDRSVKRAMAIVRIAGMKDAKLKAMALAELGLTVEQAAANDAGAADLFSAG